MAPQVVAHPEAWTIGEWTDSMKTKFEDAGRG
jgi:hypothetical protein